MEDLTGLNWSKQSNATRTNTANYSSAFPTLKPTPPTSGRATPLNQPSQPPSKPATPANDIFSNLVSFSNSNPNAKLSLAEQQKRLADLKLRQQAGQVNTLQDQYSGGDDIWNTLGSGRTTPAPRAQKNTIQPSKPAEDEADLFAAFTTKPKQQSQPQAALTEAEEDDDPFGLQELKTGKTRQGAAANGHDDDDVLGLLGQPILVKPAPEGVLEEPPTLPANAHPQGKAVAELVDMGFPAGKAQRALETTESGIDVQAAVGWLLNQAHSEAREQSQGRDGPMNGRPSDPRRRADGRSDQTFRQRTFDEDEEPGIRRRQESQSTEKDPAQVAAELGNQFLKTANTWWKQGSKKVQQAMQELNSDSESGTSGQPKWMTQADSKPVSRRQQGQDEARTARRRRRSSQDKLREQSTTDEAMMLEAERPTPPSRPQPRARQEQRFDSSADNSRDHSPVMPSRLRESHSPQPAFLRQQQARPSPQHPPSRAALTRQTNEDAAAQAYVSSARRRKPAQAAAQASDPDLLKGSSNTPLPVKPSIFRPTQPVPPPKKATPIAVRPEAPPRNIPSVSAISLKASHSHREKGNEHFKRGDYSSAHHAYGTSISHLPATHPVTIVLLTNHALTALKTGEPKTAITDCDKAMAIIGIAKGESETIDFGNGENAKPMRDYYGKALMRKAEALEQMEKWSEAAAVWREAVEGGHGGATSMQGRLRAEKAANPQASKPKPPIANKPAVTARPAVRSTPAMDSAAVSRLRAANAAADKTDDEKFALSDSVDARIKTWRDGKQDNLRALLGSLDTVLWAEAGWKKISMADLVLPQKVKIQYMKGIGKVHPDKISTNATTEQKMISASVFSTLNEAWDKFKTDNKV